MSGFLSILNRCGSWLYKRFRHPFITLSHLTMYFFDTSRVYDIVEPELVEATYLPLGEKEKEDQTWVDFVHDIIYIPKFSYSYNFQLPKSVKIDRLEQSPADCHSFSEEFMPNPCLKYDNVALNQFYDSQVEGAFTSGHTSEARLFPVNANGNPLKLTESYYRVTVGNGLYYSQKNVMQSIQVVQGRYVCPLKNYDQVRAGDGGYGKLKNAYEKAMKEKVKLTEDWDKYSMEGLAHKIADYMFDTCMKPFNIGALETEMNSLYIEFIRSSRAKSYSAKYLSQLNSNPRLVNFHLKTIFKAKIAEMTKSGVKKVGQGISAWAAVAQNYFSLTGKIMNYAFFRSLNGNVVYDNRMTPEELIEKTNKLNSKINPLADNVVTDYNEYDKKQNLFTMMIEKRLWRRLGFSEFLVETYYSFRKNYLIVSKFISARVRYAKTSGEPLTLVNNTILNLALTHFLVQGEGPWYIVVKGDDGWKRQLNLRLQKDRLLAINKFVDLNMKISFEDSIEFCGCLVTKQGLVVNLMRKLYKLLGHNFKDLEHFQEYQIGLRDFIRLLQTLDVAHVVRCNQKFLECSQERVYNIIYTLQSFSHIDEEQFYDRFTKYDINYGYPTKQGMNI